MSVSFCNFPILNDLAASRLPRNNGIHRFLERKIRSADKEKKDLVKSPPTSSSSYSSQVQFPSQQTEPPCPSSKSRYRGSQSQLNLIDIVQIEDILSILKEYTCINSLLNSSSKLKEEKKRYFYWRLNGEKSYAYCFFNRFRAQLNSRLAKSNLQISVNLSTNLSIGISNVSALGIVHSLNLTDCVFVTNVSALGNVCHLNLSGCIFVTDVSGLVNCESLNLTGCTGIRDVSTLGKIRYLNLTDCTGIRDIANLGKVQDLVLKGCTGVKDVCGLRNVGSLSKALDLEYDTDCFDHCYDSIYPSTFDCSGFNSGFASGNTVCYFMSDNSSYLY